MENLEGDSCPISILDRAEAAAARLEREATENSSIHDFAISSSSPTGGTPLVSAEDIHVNLDLKDFGGCESSSPNPLGRLGFVGQVVATRARKLMAVGLAVSIKAASALRPVRRSRELVAQGKERLEPMCSKLADASKAKAGQGARWMSAKLGHTRDALSPFFSGLSASARSALGPVIIAKDQVCRLLAEAIKQRNFKALCDKLTDAGARIREEFGPVCRDLAASGKDKLGLAFKLVDSGRARAGQGAKWMCAELNRTRETFAPICHQAAASGKDKLGLALTSARQGTAGAVAAAKRCLASTSGQGKSVVVASLCGAALGIAAQQGTLSLRSHPCNEADEADQDDRGGAWPWGRLSHPPAHMNRIFKLIFLSHIFSPV